MRGSLPQKKQRMHRYVYACIIHDDLVTRERQVAHTAFVCPPACCVHEDVCGCTNMCRFMRFGEVTWSGEWVVNFSSSWPVWLSWSSMLHRARCRGFELPAHHLKIELDEVRSRKALEFAATCVSHIRVRLPAIVRRLIACQLHQLLINSVWPKHVWRSRGA